MILVDEIIKKMIRVDNSKSIVFLNGSLIVTQSGYLKDWSVDLIEVENSEFLLDMIENRKQVEFEFLCESGKIYEGSLIFKSSNGINFKLLGTGPLKNK